MSLQIKIIPEDLNLTDLLPEETNHIAQISYSDFPNVADSCLKYNHFVINQPVNTEVIYWRSPVLVPLLYDVVDRAMRLRATLNVLDYRVFEGNEEYVKNLVFAGHDVLLYVIQGTKIDLNNFFYKKEV